MSDNNVGDKNNSPPYAPPIFKNGDLLISQTPKIMSYLGPKLGLVPLNPGCSCNVWEIYLRAYLRPHIGHWYSGCGLWDFHVAC